MRFLSDLVFEVKGKLGVKVDKEVNSKILIKSYFVKYKNKKYREF